MKRKIMMAFAVVFLLSAVTVPSVFAESTGSDGSAPVDQQLQNASSAISKQDVSSGNSGNGPVAINSENFPDQNFCEFVKNYDSNKDNSLSQAELDAVTDMNLNDSNVKSQTSGIEDLTGIKHFSSLQSLTLNPDDSELQFLDLSGMQKLQKVDMTGLSNVMLLDCRGCPNLQYIHPSADASEIIEISYGMTKYTGWEGKPGYTGNVVVDLDKNYSVNQDGSKTIDISKAISQELINTIDPENSSYAGYNKDSKTLTIAADKKYGGFYAGYRDENTGRKAFFLFEDLADKDYSGASANAEQASGNTSGNAAGTTTGSTDGSNGSGTAAAQQAPADRPQTGDDFPLALCGTGAVAGISAIAVLIAVSRRRQAK